MTEYEDLKNRFRDRVFADKEKTPRIALENAYADMSRRQSGHSAALKESCFDWLVKEIFAQAPQISDFDSWHEERCTELIAKWSLVNKSFGTVGKAQKVINMAFKYLSCIDPEYDRLLPHCHMTLDSYTLAWYKKSVQPWVQEQKRPDVKAIVAWSKITSYGEYMLIQENIREYLRTEPPFCIEVGNATTPQKRLPTSPIDAEFIIWEGQIVEEKYSNLIKELTNYVSPHKKVPAGRENDAWILGNLFTEFLKDYCQNL